MLVFERADESMYELLRRVGPLQEGHIACAGMHIARACEHLASRGIVHRNVCARAVFVFHRENAVKLGDFSMARALEGPLQHNPTNEPEWESRHWTALPPAYAPEMKRGVSLPASDVYMFGWFLWEMGSGGENPPAHKAFRAPLPTSSRWLLNTIEVLTQPDIPVRPSWPTVQRLLAQKT
jgi:serine/threonine protein kinase